MGHSNSFLDTENSSLSFASRVAFRYLNASSYTLLDVTRLGENWQEDLPEKFLGKGSARSGVVFIKFPPGAEIVSELRTLKDYWNFAFLPNYIEFLRKGRTPLAKSILRMRRGETLLSNMEEKWGKASFTLLKSPGPFIRVQVTPPFSELVRSLVKETRETRGKYYWRSNRSSPVKAGFLVPPLRWEKIKSQGSPFRVKGEIFMEKIRQEDFPNKPSRIGSIFVCPSLSGFCAKQPGKPVYEVEVKGKTFLTDGGAFSDAIASIDPDERIAQARNYWRGVSKPYLPEVLVQGTVRVIRRVL